MQVRIDIDIEIDIIIEIFSYPPMTNSLILKANIVRAFVHINLCSKFFKEIVELKFGERRSLE